MQERAAFVRARQVAGDEKVGRYFLDALHPFVWRRSLDFGAIGEVQAMGVLVKDLDTGLVDFPATRDGEDILLCWQLGEDEVAYWHGLEDGYAGRQPL